MVNGENKRFYLDVIKATIGILMAMLLCRFAGGAMGVVIVLVGVMAVFARRPGLAATCYIMIPVIQVFNRALVGMGSLLFIAGRFGAPVIIAALIVSGVVFNRQRCEKLPIGWMWAYLFVACLSSFDGWMPLVSYFKIAYFGMMLIGLVLISKFMQLTDGSLRFLRAVYMALAVIFIVGSVVSYLVPSVGYSMTIYKMAAWGMDVTGEEVAQSATGSFFNGMSCHSQALSPIVMSLAAWVAFDMILIMRKVTLLHSGILVCVPLLAYMSRSRGALLMLVTVMGMITFYALPKVRLPQRIKSALRFAVMVGVTAVLAIGISMQLKNDMLSKWLRKTDNVAGDTRSLGEAFTSSRQGLVQMNLDDFRRNPLIGKGFQVSIWMSEAARSKDFNWFTAAVEKGVTPYVILAETGILGALVFICFLIRFYSYCSRRRLLALMTAFTVMLVANLADSSLFSPSYIGGFMWTLSCIGAFALDIMARRINEHSDSYNPVGSMNLGW